MMTKKINILAFHSFPPNLFYFLFIFLTWNRDEEEEEEEEDEEEEEIHEDQFDLQKEFAKMKLERQQRREKGDTYDADDREVAPNTLDDLAKVSMNGRRWKRSVGERRGKRRGS